MFSMSAAVTLEEVLRTARIQKGTQRLPDPRASPSGLADLDRVLPDAGFPQGLTELAAPRGAGGGSTIALSTMKIAQAKHHRVYCAWIEAREDDLLYAPFVDRVGVSRERLVVVRAPVAALGRAALEVIRSGAFDVVAVRVPGHLDARVVRKLALFAEEQGGAVLLLTDAFVAHTAWPVALRVELLRTLTSISVKVTRDKRGRTGSTGHVSLSRVV